MAAEDKHTLLNTRVAHRVRLAWTFTGKRGRLRPEEVEHAMVLGYLKRMLSVTNTKA